MKLNEKQESLINDLANDFKEFVKSVERGISTTKNNYGRYGQMISSLSKGNRMHAEIYALAMMKAGANAQGVKDALKCFC